MVASMIRGTSSCGGKIVVSGEVVLMLFRTVAILHQLEQFKRGTYLTGKDIQNPYMLSVPVVHA